MSEIIESFMFMVLIVAIVLAIFGLALTLFAIAIYVGALLGWIISLTVLGEWVRIGFQHFGFSVNLTYLGAMLSFIGSLFNVRIISPTITSIIHWVVGRIREESD